MALLHSTRLYVTLPLLLPHSTRLLKLLYHGSTSLYYRLYITLLWLHLTLLDSTLLYHGSTSIYITWPCLTWIYITLPLALLLSTWLYITLPWTQLHSTWLYLSSTMALLHSTRLYITLRWLYFTLHWLYIMALPWLKLTFLDQGSTSPYLNLPWLVLHSSWTLHNYNIVSTTRYLSLRLLYLWLYFTLLDSKLSPPWLYFTLLGSTLLYNRSTSIYLTLHHCTMVLLHSTWLYIKSTMALLRSTMNLHNSSMTLLHSTEFLKTIPWVYFVLLAST